jgi:hypothetical protein
VTLTPEQRQWPRLMEVAPGAGVGAEQLRRLAATGAITAVRDGREWRVMPGTIAAYLARRKIGRPRKGQGRKEHGHG